MPVACSIWSTLNSWFYLLLQLVSGSSTDHGALLQTTVFLKVYPTIDSVLCGHVHCGFHSFWGTSWTSCVIKYHCWLSNSTSANWLLILHKLCKWHSFVNVELFKSVYCDVYCEIVFDLVSASFRSVSHYLCLSLYWLRMLFIMFFCGL